MKHLIFTALFGAASLTTFAQTATVKQETDTVIQKKDTTIHKKGTIIFNIGNTDEKDTTYHSKVPGFSVRLTFSRFDLGLATLLDNGSSRLSPKNEFLRYRSWKSSNVGFDVFQAGYRFNSSFKIYLSAGFDWTHIRLREDVTIQKDQDRSALKYTNDTVDYSKNRFSSCYLRIPLSFEFRTKDDNRGNDWRFVAGPDIGVLLNGRVKQISEENGKQKMDNTYHYTKFRYGGFMRIGYAGVGVFAKYYMNNMFDTAAQDGLRNFSFGFTTFF